MFLDMFLLGAAAGLLGYVIARTSYMLWQMGMPAQMQM
jgi:hypothetical protein